MGTTDEQVYRADNLHLIAFLVARGCRIKDSKLRSDRLVDFFICGDEVHNLVKEYDMKSKNTFVPVHEHKAAIVLRTARELTGPWSDGQVIVAGSRYPALYGGFQHPWAADKPAIYFTMTQWQPYNVDFFRADLV